MGGAAAAARQGRGRRPRALPRCGAGGAAGGCQGRGSPARLAAAGAGWLRTGLLEPPLSGPSPQGSDSLRRRCHLRGRRLAIRGRGAVPPPILSGAAVFSLSAPW